MTVLLGVDLGTSSVKAVVVREDGALLGVGSREYPILTPELNWAEQNPQTWWEATIYAVQQAVSQAGVSVSAIGLSGQMHGTVLIDGQGAPLGNAIIWPDQRSAAEVNEMTAQIGSERLASIAGTAPATGFMASTLLWLKHHDTKRVEQAKICLLPKDYIRLRLTGVAATDASDASATALFDVPKRKWSREIVDALGLPYELLPKVLNSSDVAGTLVKTAADSLGLPKGVPVVAGCADQAAQAVGNGLLAAGDGSVTLGSGGQIFVPLEQPRPDSQLRLHLFCHAPENRWYLLGAMLTAGLSLRWFRDLLGWAEDADAYERLASMVRDVPAGVEGLLFLPYLAGERAPVMDPLARGCFIGLRLHHGQGHLTRAIMEGVAFALRQIRDTMSRLDVQVNKLLAAGNGLTSPVWRQIVADVLGQPLYLREGRERTAVGAALVAGVGTGVYSSYEDTLKVIETATTITEPNLQNVQFYNEQYARYCQLYPTLKSLFHKPSTGQL
jgi:xylulokinase